MNKEKILAFFSAEDEITNTDVRNLLECSDRTAVRYLDELEREDKIRQIGKTGRWVVYRQK